MASLKNSPGEYCLEQKAFLNQQQYLHYKNSRESPKLINYLV